MTRSMGFTGTQHGMSDGQKQELRLVLVEEGPIEFHHGDCVGADEEADAIAREVDDEVAVVIHPPSNPSKRAYCAKPGDVVWEPAPYRDRDLDIVESSSTLVAAPLSDREQGRSGTWYTVRAARRSGRRVIVLRRDGGRYE